MSRRIVFVGGIHGTGKSAVCAALTKRYFADYLSASQLIKWNKQTKQVEDVTGNQRLLSSLIKKETKHDFTYVIDGHFSLWNKHNECETVPVETFEGIHLSAIVLVICKPSVVQQRILKRDAVEYSIGAIEQLQKLEIEQARAVAEYFQIPRFVLDNTESCDVHSIFNDLDIIMKPYTRDNIYSEMLKTVVIRLDFVGATKIRDFVDKIKQTELLNSAFNSMVAMPKQRLSVSFRPKDLEDGGLPLAESQHSTLYRFKDCKLQDVGIATLDIDCESITIVVDCRTDYKGSKKYTDFMSDLMKELFAHDKYITPIRLGVRKIDIQILKEGESMGDYFNDKYIVASTWNTEPQKRLASLTELSSIDNIDFNIIQRIDRTNNGNVRLIYDVDSYIKNGHLAQVIANEEIKNVMEIMQNHMFDMFVNVTSVNYLDKCKAAKEAQNG